MEKFLILIKTNLCFPFITCAVDAIYKKSVCYPNYEDLLLSFLLRILPLTFRSMIHFKLIFAYGTDIQFYSFHLLGKIKTCSFPTELS